MGGKERYSVSERMEKWVEEERKSRFTTASWSWGIGRRQLLVEDVAFFLNLSLLSLLPCFLLVLPPMENKRVKKPIRLARAYVSQVTEVDRDGCLRYVSILWENAQYL